MNSERTEDWAGLTAETALGGGEVHVWRARLDWPEDALTAARAMLNDGERARADRFLRAEHGRRFTACRALLRALLGGYVGMAPASIEFQYNKHGKPSVDGGVTFNISHSRDWALLAFARNRAIGVDVEAMAGLREGEKIARRFFSPREVEALLAVPDGARLEAFYRCWARKEAYMKGRGLGLALGLDNFDVSLGPDELPRLLWCADGPDEPSRWRLHELHPAAGFMGALAVEGGDGALRFGTARPEDWFSGA